jgi:hypothetical protein
VAVPVEGSAPVPYDELALFSLPES